MAWRLAKSLAKLRGQVDAKWPKRSKTSDGSIGDEAHASRSSDHNPWIADADVGVVSAIDITHDLVRGFDSYAFAEALRLSRDQRIKYVISNGRVFSSARAPWQWRKYSGSNPHDLHVHISVKSAKAHYDDASPWPLDDVPPSVKPAKSAVSAPEIRKPVLRRGASCWAVKELQRLLEDWGAKLKIDGKFGVTTETAVMRFQKKKGLAADGVVGPYTWRELLG